MSIIVSYNGQNLDPTPIVNTNIEFINYGTYWGNIVNIELNGILTGINSTGDVKNLTNIFTEQFKNLEVYEQNTGLNLIYSWPYIAIDDISFPASHFNSGTMVNYNVKLKSYNMPSGIIEPSNEYSFTQNDDGTVNVTHKISARGIRDSSIGINNAINFVKLFTGKNPYNNCASYFIQNQSGILLSFNENIDRLNCIYSVSEMYKYNTGEQNLFIKNSNIGIIDSLDSEYITLDYDLKLKGSPIYKNLSDLDNYVGNFDIFSELNDLGLDTGNMVQFGLNISRDSGECYIELKSSIISGYSTNDINGFLNYDITLSKDDVLPKESWKLEGDFICRGPLSYKKQQLQNFKNNYQSDWRGYLLGILSGSPIFISLHNPNNLLNTYPTINIQENTGLGTFKLALGIDDGGEPIGLSSPKYEVEIEPSRWLFELLPSANIEGHYIVQDLQTRTQSKIRFNLSSDSEYPATYMDTLSGLITGLQGVYLEDSGFYITETHSSGINDMSVSKMWIGQGKLDSGILYTKLINSTLTDYTRKKGYIFGF